MKQKLSTNGEIIMKILVGYDGTNAAKEALNLAKMHAKSFEYDQ